MTFETSRRPAGPPLLLLLLLALGLLVGGCVVSEQAGMRTDRVTFHFDTPFDLAMVIGRSAALLGVAGWVLAARNKGTWTMVGVVSLPATVAAIWLAVAGMGTIRHCRIVIDDSDLVLSIPPAAERRIPWLAMEEMTLEGVKYEGKGFLNLPEWNTLELKLAGGESVVVDVARLSVEHRQNLADLIADRVKNARQGTKPIW